jgi:hypothetical protein
VTAISLADWARRIDAGETTYAVGPVTAPVPFLDRTEAEAAADELDGTYIEWVGRTGHQLATPEFQAAIDTAEPEPEMEIV